MTFTTAWVATFLMGATVQLFITAATQTVEEFRKRRGKKWLEKN